VPDVDQFFLEAFSSEHRRDPYPLYRRYVEAIPPLAPAGPGLWLSLDHEVVTAVLRHPNVSSDERRATLVQQMMADDPTVAERLEDRSLLFLDPPDHTRIRRLVSKAFTPATVDRLRPQMVAMVDDLLDGLAAQTSAGSIDIVTGFAYPFPLRVICELLGVPFADRDHFHGWSKALARGVDPGVLRPPEVEAEIEAASAALRGYLADLFEERRRQPQDDLVTALLQVEDGGDRLSAEELMSLVVLLLVAGHETTVNLIGNGLAALVAHPDQMTLARTRGIDRTAVDELLRFDSPVQMNQRVAAEPFEVAGAHLAAGDQVVLILAGANRNPRAYPDPDRLDLTRNGPPHVAFGGGLHHCLGAALARTEAELALNGLLRRFPRIEDTGERTLRPTFTLRGYETFPVALG
jgi:cytochrome P450